MGKISTKNFKAFLFIEEERFAAPTFKQLQQYVKSIGCESIDECIEKKAGGSLEKFISDWYKAVEYSAEYRNHLKENNVFFYIDSETPKYYHVEIIDEKGVKGFNSAVKAKLIYFKSKTHSFYPGQTVEHKMFGLGKVVSFTGDLDTSDIIIKFDKVGEKKLNISYAKLLYENEPPYCIANISVKQKLVIDITQDQLKDYTKVCGFKSISKALESLHYGSWEDLAIGWFNSIQKPNFYSDYLKLNNIYYSFSDNAESQANIIENEQEFLDLKEGDGGLIFN